MRHPLLWTLGGIVVAGALGLAARRAASDRHARQAEADLFAVDAPPPVYSEARVDDLPEPARRYLRHAIAPGTPLAPACRLWMDGTMTPTPGAAPTRLTAVETLAPRRGFVWTAHARMNGLPVRVRDHYLQNDGGIDVVAVGLVPVPLASGPDVTRSSRGRLVGEAVWCPTALVHPDVAWEAVDDDRARFTIRVDGDPVAVTIRVDADGALREVGLDRWGDPDGEAPRLHPYGFRVEAEGTFDGVTIPTRITGGWGYGTGAYDPATAASFIVRRAALAGGGRAATR